MGKKCKTCGQIKEKHPYYLSNTLACGLFEEDDKEMKEDDDSIQK
ncbi:MAG: hypothetical protein ACFFD1_00935 [Candidatus Thorarchaeota archaeon]